MAEFQRNRKIPFRRFGVFINVKFRLAADGFFLLSFEKRVLGRDETEHKVRLMP